MGYIIDFGHTSKRIPGLDDHCFSFLNFENGLEDLGYGGLVWENTAPSYIFTQSSIKKKGSSSLALNLNYSSPSTNRVTTTNSSLKQLFGNSYTIDWWEYRLSSFPHGSEQPYTAYTSLEFLETNSSSQSDFPDSEIIILKDAANNWLILHSDSIPELSDWHGTSTKICDIEYDKWNHIAISFDTNNYYIFYNGSLKSVIPSTNYLPNIDIINIGINIVADSRLYNDQKCYLFHGYMDMIRISDIVRWTTDFDINHIYD